MQYRKFVYAPLFAALICPAVSITPAAAEVKVPAVIGSHMVLQRGMPVPIWGTAGPGEKVTVSFRKQVKSATADPKGKWRVKLAPLKAGGPDVMKIAGANTITLRDILVGEVWVGSGQSNMDLTVPEATGGDPVLAKAAAKSYPKIRLIVTDQRGWKPGVRNWQAATRENVAPLPVARWREATPKNIARFSALLFSFGMRLQKELDVPVGLVEGAVGATPSVCWLSREAYESDAACKTAVEKYAAAEYPKVLDKQRKAWLKAVAKAKGEGAPPPAEPRPWRKSMPGAFGGNWKMGVVATHYENRIRPLIPYGIGGVLWDQGETGTGITGVDQFTMMGALIRCWRKDWGQGDFPFIYVQKPSGAGCAWDYEDPVTRSSRKFSPLPEAVPGTKDGLYNENHIRIMQYPKTAMAVSSDLGPKNHPDNKSGYGTRAARVALGMVYGRKVEIYGPVYESHRIEGDKVRVSFTHAGQGLAIRHAEKLQGFAIAGQDKVFQWADAVIDGETVVVSSDKVKKPVAVRYGWGNIYPWANLFNKDGLPALPFRTDAWE